MKQLTYTMRFSGKAVPKAGATGVFVAATEAASSTFSSLIGEEGLVGWLQPLQGGKAFFESEVTITGETSFKESGTIRFGKSAHLLRFSTVGEGFLDKSPEEGLQHGSVIWRVEGGEGQFAGANGLITSNFTLSTAGDVIDHHLGLIFVQ